MPVSIVDYESLIRDPLSLGLFQGLRRMNDLIKLVPVAEVGSLVVQGQQWATLPSGHFRDVNQTFTESTGKTKPVEDRLAIFGGAFNVDKVFDKLKVPLLQDPTETQFKMWNKAIDRQMSDNFINGDIDTDPKGYNGLYKRLTSGTIGGSANAHVVSASGTTDSLKVHASADTAKQFFEKLDEAMYLAGLWGSALDGVPKGALWMNKTSWLGIQKAARMTGYSIDQIDLLGYTWKSYRGIPFVDVGLKYDMATEIIGDSYDPGDSGNDASRIFVCRFASPDGDIESVGADGLQLAQVGGYEALGPEEYNTYRAHALQWVLGPTHIGDPFCAALLDDFKMAAS